MTSIGAFGSRCIALIALALECVAAARGKVR